MNTTLNSSSPPAVHAVDGLNLPIPRLPVASDQNAAGEPSVGHSPLFMIGDTEIGVWEMGVGSMYDTESLEVFVVLAGEATIETLDASGLVTDRTEVKPGTVCRLSNRTRTRWIVRRTLRKVYIAAP